jgi:hypothetical protein
LAAWPDVIDAYLDGLMTGEEKLRFEREASKSESIRRELELARRVRIELAATPKEACPDGVYQAIVEHARASRHAESWLSRLRARGIDWWSVGLTRPALVAAMLVLVAVSGVLFLGRRTVPEVAETVPTAEVERALTDVKWALAYVSDAGLRTARVVRDDVLHENLAVPVVEALELAEPSRPIEPRNAR